MAAGVMTCSSSGAPTRAAAPARALWEGTWSSSGGGKAAGAVSALFPDPLPKQGSFTVEATISYGEGPRRIEKKVTTTITAASAAVTGDPQFKGVIVEEGGTITYTARSGEDLTELNGEYESVKPDDRGTFHLRKTTKAP
ncbi:MAG: hypothetical protein KA369_10045 [Spirochaetes bacterium]|nr:hypothetical protein [Spirochaetota bacterium]